MTFGTISRLTSLVARMRRREMRRTTDQGVCAIVERTNTITSPTRKRECLLTSGALDWNRDMICSAFSPDFWPDCSLAARHLPRLVTVLDGGPLGCGTEMLGLV